MALTITKNLLFIDSMQFMNSSLDRLFKNLTGNGFNYLSQEFDGGLLKLVKQKWVYPYEYMDSFKRFSEDKLPNRCDFYSSVKDVYISEKDYLHAGNVWSTLKRKVMVDYYDFYLKTDGSIIIWCFWKFNGNVFKILWIRSLALF